MPKVHAIYSDPRTWQHYPSGCFSFPRESETLVRNWIDGWEEDGLSSWLITDPNTNDLLGNCGVRMRRGAYWNLGYRLAPQAFGRGIASRVAAYSVQRAIAADPDRPVVASLLEHNVGSAKVAERAGLAVRFRGPDVGNPNAKQCVSSMPIAS